LQASHFPSPALSPLPTGPLPTSRQAIPTEGGTGKPKKEGKSPPPHSLPSPKRFVQAGRFGDGAG